LVATNAATPTPIRATKSNIVYSGKKKSVPLCIL
jgi:hypothetical protein